MREELLADIDNERFRMEFEFESLLKQVDDT
jgi:hypothetical protein